MPRAIKKDAAGPPGRVLVVDNGAFTIKAGFVTQNPDSKKDCNVIPNCIARGQDGPKNQKLYVADQLDECKDFAEMVFRRPVEKGYLVNWEAELDIWKQVFFNNGAKVHCDPYETTLVLTEAPNAPQALQHNCDQVIFEEMEFASAFRCVGPALNAYNDIPALTDDPQSGQSPVECLLVIDSGHSHTTVTPLLYSRPIHAAMRRLNIGGKHLTNYLKEVISLRHIMVMDEPHLVTQMKEDACFVSLDVPRDLDSVWKGQKKSIKISGASEIVQEYVLPDYVTTSRGHLRPHDPARTAITARIGQGTQLKEEFVTLGNERFLVPEIIFNPSDIGMAQAGLAETIVQSLSCLPAGLWPAMLANIVVVGGNAQIPEFVDRLRMELRALTPADCEVRVYCPEDPVTYTWLGGAKFAADADRLKNAVVTRQEYQEHGEAWAARRFAGAPR